MPTHKASLAELSISQLSELTGKAPRTISKRLERAQVATVREDGKTLYYAPQVALAAIYQEGTPQRPDAEKARLDAARADLAELELEERRGDLIGREDVVNTWSNRIAACKARLRAIPKRLVVQVPGFNRAMAKRALELIDDALHELAGASQQSAPRRARVGKRKKRVAAAAEPSV